MLRTDDTEKTVVIGLLRLLRRPHARILILWDADTFLRRLLDSVGKLLPLIVLYIDGQHLTQGSPALVLLLAPIH